MELNVDFTIELFKAIPEFRSDNGKKNNYPEQHKCQDLIDALEKQAGCAFSCDCSVSNLLIILFKMPFIAS